MGDGLRALVESFNGGASVVGKYAAPSADNIRAVLTRLSETDPHAADTIRWLCWWHLHHQQGLKWREDVIGELNLTIAGLRTAQGNPGNG